MKAPNFMKHAIFIVSLSVVAFAADSELFEKKIRPVLAAKCYGCHSSKLKSPMGGLVLDTKAGTRRVIESGKMLRALQFTDPKLQMPPSGKLPDTVIADFEGWISGGAIDPRMDVAVSVVASGMSIEKGRQWWSFQPVKPKVAPVVKDRTWPKTKTDRFVLAQLESGKLAPSKPADRRTLIHRVTLDLTGLRPSYEDVEAFVADRSADSYERLVERLLASPQYGERWGRYWMDVSRYAEDNPTTEATNPAYAYAWRYRDWVIDAVNRDMPYDRFVKMQLAADQLPGATRNDLAALGYVGAAPVYHKDARLSKEVIENLASDDWDERVDAVTRGLLGLTVACARCHDHKFDPIPTKDYYALAGVFASSPAVERPLADMPPGDERRFLWIQQRMIHLDYLAKLLTGEPGTKPEEAKEKVVRFKAEFSQLRKELDAMGERYPFVKKYAARFDPPPQRKQGEPPATRRGNLDRSSDAPFVNAVYDAGMYVDGSDGDLTVLDFQPGKARDLPVFLRGNSGTTGEAAPRRFLTVLSKGGSGYDQGASGRLDLANQMFRDAGPLAARVMVNRVWAWHFGKPLVPTLSDFGTQGEKPSHPKLLEDLAARFIENGWSLKWLHREMVLSAAYRQASNPRADGEKVDPTNRLLWRMNARRLDIEAFRDSLIATTGELKMDGGGPSTDVDLATNQRRTVYGRISRARTNPLLRLYDFPDPSQHSPARDLTVTPLQQLFVMNSSFLESQATKLAVKVEEMPDGREKIQALYRRIFSRDPSPKELDLGMSFLNGAGMQQYTQALLSTNEFIFWP